MNEGDELRRSLERLVALGRTPDVDIRPVLLRVVVDLFARKPHHAPSALAQFEEIVAHLLAQADPEARRIVAEKLARHPATPQALLDRFFREGGEVAQPVLEYGALDGPSLSRAASWGTAEAAAAVARRGALEPALVRELADRPEREVLLALVRNAAAPVDRPMFQYLVRRARGDDDLAEALLARDGHPLDLAPLFLLASERQRADIVLAFRRDDLSPDKRRPTLDARERDMLAGVERAIEAADRDGRDAALAAALRVPPALVWRLADDPGGEALALALAAVGVSPEFAARLFILSGPAIGQSVAKVRLLTRLVETVPRRTAARIIGAVAGIADLGTRAVSEPELPARKRAETPAVRPARPARERTEENPGRRNGALAR